jgi:hypothetical protein
MLHLPQLIQTPQSEHDPPGVAVPGCSQVEAGGCKTAASVRIDP